MSKILALMGRASSGKTTTISLLPAILLAHGYTQVPGMYVNHGADFLDAYTDGKIKLGITSAGDFESIVRDRLTILVAAGCDVCICACRTYGGTHVAIQSFTTFTHHFQQKTYAATVAQEPIVNAADANTMFSLI